jgi:CelD/BcsL family acetyltransferase involved in cellulose biosynthesis
MDVKKLDINSPEWFAFIEAHPDSTIFHHPAWGGLIVECYGYKPFILAKLNELGQVDVGIPFMDVNSRMTGHRWVSLPFSDHCTPLFRDRRSLDAMVEFLMSQYKQKAIPRVEIRSSIPLRDTIYQDNSFVWHTIKLNNDPEALIKTFSSRVREPIRQAVKKGVEVRWGTVKADMNVYYTLSVFTHRRLGIPVQPRRFFDLLWDRLIEKKLGFLLLAYRGHEPIAGTVFLYYKKMLTAKYNASRPEYWKLKANNLLYWSAIKWGCENGFTCFDFGRTDASNQNLRDFKSGWGSQEQILHYSVLADHPPAATLTGVRQKRVLAKIIQHSPTWVCRAIGEILYGHFA